MRKGVIIDMKNQYTYVLYHDAKVKRIKREYYHEIGKEITLPYISMTSFKIPLILACLLLVISIIHPVQATNSYISLSVNPGLVFKVDEHEKVVAVSYTNKDGQALTSQVNFVDESLEDSITLFIDYCFENHYFQNNNNIDINVICDDQSQVTKLESKINQIVNHYLDSHSVSFTLSLDKVSDTQKQEANALDIPDSKVKLIDLILYYYPNLDKKDLAKESVDDLIDLLENQGLDDDLFEHLEEKYEDDDDEDDDFDDD